MPVQTFDSVDAVPEDVRPNALALADGKFAVFVEEDVAGLKRNQERLRVEKQAAASKASELEARLAEIEANAAARAAGMTDEQIKRIRDEMEAKTAPILAERDTLAQRLRELTLDRDVRERMAKAGVRGDRLDALWRLHGSDFDLTDEGTPYVKADPSASIEDYIGKKLLKDYPEFAVPSAAAGGGGSRGTGGGAAAGQDPRGWTSVQKAEYIRTEGVDAFRALVAKAATAKK